MNDDALSIAQAPSQELFSHAWLMFVLFELISSLKVLQCIGCNASAMHRLPSKNFAVTKGGCALRIHLCDRDEETRAQKKRKGKRTVI
eukprot:193664-Pelagomonas_calceolata.AAC.5